MLKQFVSGSQVFEIALNALVAFIALLAEFSNLETGVDLLCVTYTGHSNIIARSYGYRWDTFRTYIIQRVVYRDYHYH